MHSLYVLQSPSAPPVAPERWSYSDLVQWRQCPRRWWLLRAHYPAGPAGGARVGYPERYGPAALRGRLVHAALEAYRNSLQGKANESFQARTFLKRWLRDWQAEERERNPRIDAEALRARLSLDECMAEFRSLAAHVPLTARGTGSARDTRVTGPRAPRDAPEYWIAVDDPPLKGRIDRVQGGRLIDFKTGSFQDEHQEQLRFYALLWWLKFREAPAGLKLLYADAGRAQMVPVPSLTEMAQLAQSFREEVEGVRVALGSPPVPARPAAETCKGCPVRQLCQEYWRAPATEPLRTPGEIGDGMVGYRDVHLTRLPTLRQSGPLIGVAVAAGFGAVGVLFERGKCPGLGDRPAQAAFLLGARVEKLAGAWEIRASASGEIFWEPTHSRAPTQTMP